MRKIFTGTKEIPHLVSRSADTIHYPDLIKVNNIQTDLGTGKITDYTKFNTGNLCMVTGGATLGRTGAVTRDEEKGMIQSTALWALQCSASSSPQASLAPTPVIKKHRARGQEFEINGQNEVITITIYKLYFYYQCSFTSVFIYFVISVLYC